MHQLTLFAPTEPTPAPAKKSFKAKPSPTKKSGLEVDPNIATKPPEPTQAEAPRLTQISPNQSPTVPAKLIVISYEISEPIAIGDTVMLRDGTVGTVKKYAYNDKDLPTGVKPCQQEGLREIVVSTAAGDRDVYAYQVTKIKTKNSWDSVTATVSGDELSQEPTQEQETGNQTTAISYEFSEKEIAWWKDREIEVRIEWLALDNSIAMVRDLATKKPYNVPVSELQPVIASKNLSHSSNKEESPIVANATGKKGGIITFGITTKRAARMGVAEPIVAGIKICTRRQWAQRTADYYQRCYESGQTVQAYSIDTRVKDAYKMADIRITKPLYQQALKDMPESDLVAEGGLWATKEDFINTVCKGKPDPDLVVWVCWFEVVNICV